MQILKILRSDEWNELKSKGESAGAPIDVQDGFIHFSTPAQAEETARKHFAGQNELFLLAFDSEAFGPELRWEVSRGGDLFPHLYAPLRLADVNWAQPLPLVDGVHEFPAGVLE